MNKIPGGFYIKARKIQESAIMHAPPHVREIWDWLLMRAMFSTGSQLQRGELVASYDDIRNGLAWYVGFRKERYTKWDCEKAMKYLTKEQMITTTKTTRGLKISVVNYDYYQKPDNYESHYDNHNEATMKPQTTDTIDKKEKKVKNIYNIHGEFQNVKLTSKEYDKLVDKFGEALALMKIEELSEAMASNKKYQNKYSSHYATILAWHRRKEPQARIHNKPEDFSRE